MKRSTLLIAIAFAFAFMSSCQSDSKKLTTVDSSIMSTKPVPYTAPDECFTYTNGNDVATLRMYGSGDKILGDLVYKLDGKDRNSGSIYGVLRGDTIIVNYKFQSEGKYSFREVVWVRQGDQLLEGTGDVEESDKAVKFKNIRKLTFGYSIVFNKIACK